MKRTLIILLITLGYVVTVSASISDKDFNESIKDLQTMYSNKIQKRHNKSLKVNIWQASGKAFVQCYDQVCELVIFNGIKQDESISKREFQSLLCHEIGHLLGEQYSNNSIHALINTSATSAEGESDYFSTNNCISKFLRGDLEKEIEALKVAGKMSLEVSNICQKFQKPNEQHKCIISIVASAKLLDIFPSEGTNPYQRDFRLGTQLNYPTIECRYASIVAGALNEPRPSCWYVPNEKIPESSRKN